MSLVNQVLKDLENRRGETPDTSGLTAARTSPRVRTGMRWGAIAGAAVAAGVALVLVERAMRAPEPEPVRIASVVQPVAVAETPPEPVAAFEDPAADALVAATVSEPEPEPEPVVVEESAPVATPPVAATTPAVAAPAPAVPAAERETPIQRTLIAESPRQRAADAFAAGARALAEGRRSTAETQFRLALSHDAAHHDARLALATLLATDGRVREAEVNLQEGLRIAPDHADLSERYARLLFERGDLAGAIGVLSAAPPDVAIAPDYHALRAALLQRAGNHDAAADAYSALVGVRPDNGLWWMGLAISLEGAGRPEAAVDAYARAARDPRLSTDVSRFVRERLAVLDDGAGQ